MATSPDTSKSIFNAAVTAEQVLVTLYYGGLTVASESFSPILTDAQHLQAFQGALWQEYRHAKIFAGFGGVSLASGTPPTFFYPTGTFTDVKVYLTTQLALERLVIGLYIAAAGNWANPATAAFKTVPTGMTNSQLAAIAAQIMASHAAHRSRGGDANSDANGIKAGSLPNDSILEAAPYTSVGSATDLNGSAFGVLQGFLHASPGFGDSRALPGDADIAAVVPSAIIQALKPETLQAA